MPHERRWLPALIDRCQRVACDPSDASPAEILLELRRLIAGVSPTLTPPERFIIRGLLAEIVERLAACDAAPAPADPRVHRVLSLVEARHCDPRLTLRAAACEAHLSPWHLGRLLKQYTGRGFLTHVHRARVLSARRLLEGTPLSVKEIAAAVGYANAQQLDRHFKRICGTTPVAFRQSAHVARMTAHDSITDSKN